ncbi:hypothetical protein ACFLXQ_01560 [Chloroflexota bacterium]
MNRQYFRNKLEKNKWLNQQPFTLQHFYFQAQSQLVDPLINWMKAWGQWQATYINTHGGTFGDLPEKPLPFLYVSGPRETAKTEILARGVGRYFMLNLGFPSVQYIHWPLYINSRLDNAEEEVNWDARLVILDDLDGEKPAQNHPSSWKLIQTITPLKNRVMPVLILANRALHPQDKKLSLGHFTGTTSSGKSSDELRDFAHALNSAIERKLFAAVQLNRIVPKSNGKNETIPELHARLRTMAQGQDLKELGFNFWLGEGGIEL